MLCEISCGFTARLAATSLCSPLDTAASSFPRVDTKAPISIKQLRVAHPTRRDAFPALIPLNVSTLLASQVCVINIAAELN